MDNNKPKSIPRRDFIKKVGKGTLALGARADLQRKASEYKTDGPDGFSATQIHLGLNPAF